MQPCNNHLVPSIITSCQSCSLETNIANSTISFHSVFHCKQSPLAAIFLPKVNYISSVKVQKGLATSHTNIQLDPFAPKQMFHFLDEHDTLDSCLKSLDRFALMLYCCFSLPRTSRRLQFPFSLLPFHNFKEIIFIRFILLFLPSRIRRLCFPFFSSSLPEQDYFHSSLLPFQNKEIMFIMFLHSPLLAYVYKRPHNS